MSGSLIPKAIFALAASPAVWRAAWRARRLVRALPLDHATRELTSVPRWSTAWIDRPAWLAATVDRWLPLLPPWGHGRCFRRSLVLLDLWGRSGITPVLHLGMIRDGEARQFHAWVEAHGISAGAGEHWVEIWAQE